MFYFNTYLKLLMLRARRRHRASFSSWHGDWLIRLMINHHSCVLSLGAIQGLGGCDHHHPHHSHFNTRGDLTGGHPQVIHQSTTRQMTGWKGASEACNRASPSFPRLLYNGWLNKVTSGPQATPQSHAAWCFVISALNTAAWIRTWSLGLSNTGRRWSNHLPKLCGDVINLLLMLQDLLAVSLEE